jgi:hypothetical protein
MDMLSTKIDTYIKTLLSLLFNTRTEQTLNDVNSFSPQSFNNLYNCLPLSGDKNTFDVIENQQNPSITPLIEIKKDILIFLDISSNIYFTTVIYSMNNNCFAYGTV